MYLNSEFPTTVLAWTSPPAKWIFHHIEKPSNSDSYSERVMWPLPYVRHDGDGYGSWSFHTAVRYSHDVILQAYAGNPDVKNTAEVIAASIKQLNGLAPSITPVMPIPPLRDVRSKQWRKMKESKQDTAKPSSQLQAIGKYQDKAELPDAMVNNLLDELGPEATPEDITTLARLILSSMSNNTRQSYRSIISKVRPYLPDTRQDMFAHPQPGDVLFLVARALQHGCTAEATTRYLNAYNGMVLISGGVPPPQNPRVPALRRGLTNLAHDPISKVAKGPAKAFSIHSLKWTLMGVKKMKKWNGYHKSMVKAVTLLTFFGNNSVYIYLMNN